jgi:putative transcriptional regulator
MGEEAISMAIQYKIDIMAELKKRGYSSTKIREEKLIGQSYLQQIRHGELVSWKTLDTICGLLACQPGDLLEYVKEPGVSERD